MFVRVSERVAGVRGSHVTVPSSGDTSADTTQVNQQPNFHRHTSPASFWERMASPRGLPGERGHVGVTWGHEVSSGFLSSSSGGVRALNLRYRKQVQGCGVFEFLAALEEHMAEISLHPVVATVEVPSHTQHTLNTHPPTHIHTNTHTHNIHNTHTHQHTTPTHTLKFKQKVLAVHARQKRLAHMR